MIGFAKQSDVPRHHFIAGVDVILPTKGDKNERAFTAVVSQMIETKKVMIAKIIERKNAYPKLVSLFPHFENKQALLYMVQLPTSEDLRDYQFPQLVSSTDAQRKAAGDLIDALDLTANEEERLVPELTYNPSIQYLNQVLVARMNDPDVALPKIKENIVDYLKPDIEMYTNA